MSNEQGPMEKADKAEAKRLKDIGLRLADEGRLLEAIEHFDKAEEHDNHDASIFYYRGMAFLNLGIRLLASAKTVPEKMEAVERLERALEDARVAIRVDSGMADAYFLLGMCYDCLTPERRAQLKGMAQLSFEAYLQEIRGKREASKAQKAREVLQQLTDAREELWEKEWLDTARVETAKSVADMADEIAEIGYLAAKIDHETIEERARAYQAWKEWAPKAITSMVQRWAFEHFHAAFEEGRRGRPRAATVHFLEGLRHQPDDAAALLMLGVNYEICGYPKRAEYFMQRGLELQPSDEIRKVAQEMLEKAKAGGRKVRLLRTIAKALGGKTDV